MTRPKGLIHPERTLENIHLAHHPPPGALADVVQYFWEVSWDLRGRPAYTQSNLPHPSQHIVLNTAGPCGLTGIHTGRFDYTLENTGRVLGARLRPGALCALYQGDPAELNNHRLPQTLVSDAEWQQWLRLLADQGAASVIPRLADALQAQRRPLPDPARQVGEMVDTIAGDAGLTRAEQLYMRFSLTARQCQRYFARYLGVSAKWVLGRYRIFEALQTLDDNPPNLTELAAALGYADQAHFSRLFRQLVGVSPSQYIRSAKKA